MRAAFLASVLLVAGPAAAQTAPAAPSDPAATGIHDVVVQGTRTRPSHWREAETAHVVILSDGPEAELVGYARNLERLHFLLAGLLGKPAAPDDLVKMRITLIGDVPEFQSMDLRNARWQQGPYSELFQISRYYDPREDGAVMATTRVDQRTVIERTQATRNRVLGVLQGINTGPQGAGVTAADQAAVAGALIGDFATGMAGPHDLTVGTGAHDIAVPAQSLLYAGYAQHYLMSYFPAAYPRWYLDGFGQIFSSMRVKGGNVLTFGESPSGTEAVLNEFGGYRIADLLDDSYLRASPGKTRWTPIHAWMIAHFLLFSDTRRPQLRQYLALRAQGADAATAAAVFGDPKVLAAELRRYFGSRKPYEQVTYPANLIDTPMVRRLSEGDAAFVKGRLELGSRVLIPPAPDAATPPDQARAMTRARDGALKDREAWLGRLRRDAARWPNDFGAQLLLAEAECRSDNPAACVTAATRAATMAPSDARPLAWKGRGMAQIAAAAPAGERAARLAEARGVIAAANHLDNDAVEPLLAYYRSFVAAGETPPVVAIDGLQRAVSEVPDAPASRLALATALAARGQVDVARQVVMPVAAGPYDSPERPAAQAIAARAAGQAGGAAGAP